MTLSRAARRRADREITKLIKRDGDRCSLCHAALTHNCKTFGGVTASGAVAITGECCASKLAFVLGAGFYLDRNHRYDFLRSRGSGEACPDEAAAAAIDRYREGIAAADRWTADILKRSGTPQAPRVLMSLFDSPWKDNDKAWFEENPDRSHRLRPLFPGEIDFELAARRGAARSHVGNCGASASRTGNNRKAQHRTITTRCNVCARPATS